LILNFTCARYAHPKIHFPGRLAAPTIEHAQRLVLSGKHMNDSWTTQETLTVIEDSCEPKMSASEIADHIERIEAALEDDL